MQTQELTHEENVKANTLTAKLIEAAADDFEIESVLLIDQLVTRTAEYRGIKIEAARKIVINLLEVNHEQD